MPLMELMFLSIGASVALIASPSEARISIFVCLCESQLRLNKAVNMTCMRRPSTALSC